MSTQPTSSSSPQVIKRMEKEILKEGKAEERNVKNAIQGLSNAEKSQTMAQKVRDAVDISASSDKGDRMQEKRSVWCRKPKRRNLPPSRF